METNEILARWQGVAYSKLLQPDFTWRISPDYLADSAAAMSLLDTLVEKGYTPILEYTRYIAPNCWICNIQFPSCKYADSIRTKGQTINEAIVAAVLELIER